MASEIVAYVGIDNFDVILYQASILSRMNQRVLVLELSETGKEGAISKLIPIPKGMEVNKELVTFRKIDFAMFFPSEDIINRYDKVLISCGNYVELLPSRVSKIIFVTDLFPYNMNAVKAMMKNVTFVKRAILVRNNVMSCVNQELIFEEVEGLIDKEDINILDQDENDLFNAVLIHHGQHFQFNAISWKMKRYLLKETRKYCPEADKKTIKIAFNIAKKGGITS